MMKIMMARGDKVPPHWPVEELFWPDLPPRMIGNRIERHQGEEEQKNTHMDGNEERH